MPSPGSATPRVFYGWWVAGAFVVIVFISTGIRFTAGPFLKPMVADLGIDRGRFSLVIALSLLLYGAFMPLVGRLADRFGSRIVCSAGAVVVAISLALTSVVQTYWQFVLCYGLVMSLGLSATGHVVATATLARWFVRRRGTAMSVLSAASMAAMALMVPIAAWLILTYGWRTTFVVFAIGSLVMTLPLSLWILRDAPEQMGLVPDGVPVDRSAIVSAASEQTSVSDALRLPAFWQLAGGLFNCGFSMSLLSSHGVPMLTDHGFHTMTASSAIGFLGIASMVGGMLLGVLSDRYGRKPVLGGVYVLRAGAFTALFLVHDPSMLVLMALLGGLGLSGSLAMTSALTGDIFGRLSVGSIFGLIFLAHQSGAALGSWLGGALFDATGGYGAVFTVACALLLTAAGLSFTIDVARRPAHRRLDAMPQPIHGGR